MDNSDHYLHHPLTHCFHLPQPHVHLPHQTRPHPTCPLPLLPPFLPLLLVFLVLLLLCLLLLFLSPYAMPISINPYTTILITVILIVTIFNS